MVDLVLRQRRRMHQMAVNLGGIRDENPINTAAGAFGYGWQFEGFYDVSCSVPLP